MMKKISRRSFLQACGVAAATAALTACGGGKAESKTADAHEAITFMAPYKEIEAFIEQVHKVYPEVNIEVVPYSGDNTTTCLQNMFAAGDLPDVCTLTYYDPQIDLVSDKLLDLSGYDFTDNYVESRLQDVFDNGAIYLLPSVYNCYGITYNKTLLKKYGWELPNSFAELEVLAAKAKESRGRSLPVADPVSGLRFPVSVQHCRCRFPWHAGRQTVAEGLSFRQGKRQQHPRHDAGNGVCQKVEGHRDAERLRRCS